MLKEGPLDTERQRTGHRTQGAGGWGLGAGVLMSAFSIIFSALFFLKAIVSIYFISLIVRCHSQYCVVVGAGWIDYFCIFFLEHGSRLGFKKLVGIGMYIISLNVDQAGLYPSTVESHIRNPAQYICPTPWIIVNNPLDAISQNLFLGSQSTHSVGGQVQGAGFNAARSSPVQWHCTTPSRSTTS